MSLSHRCAAKPVGRQGPGPWARALGLCPGSWAQALVLCPGSWAQALGLCPGSRALCPGPWACAQGPWPWPRALGSCPGSWALAQGPGPVPRVLGLCSESWPWAQALGLDPKSEECKMQKSTSKEKMQPRTFRMAWIDPSCQGVMNERSFSEGDINLWPKNCEKVQKRLQTTKNPIPTSIHSLFFLQERSFTRALTGISTRWDYGNR